MDPRAHPFHLRFESHRRFRREVSASSVIDAPIDRVWRRLVDFERYPEWNPFTPRIQTTLEVGAPVHMVVDMPRRSTRRVTEWVNLIEPGRTICWGMHLGAPWLLCANRWQQLEALPGGGTRYTSVDRLSGLLAPLVMLLYGVPMRLGFQAVADGLVAWFDDERSS